VARTVEKVEFTPPAPAAVTEAMARLRHAGDGWINLLPGIEGDPIGDDRAPGLANLFGPRQPAVTMGTWMPPPRTGRRARSLAVTVGLLHPQGRPAVPLLAASGTPVPSGWQVRQDHRRRGLLVRVPPDAPDQLVVDWVTEAGTALCAEPTTGEWQAVVYGPRPR
jgi:hypothetical protein